ncbi:MAG: hypothetical protein CMN30_25035 [Sandaracinus sp.]|nr:hypothetical protein [Sandaracinus sp.]|tara:strand:+ start:1327 stop:1992 length:666 start_codon:yes stop_codon:yes gene_type:complete
MPRDRRNFLVDHPYHLILRGNNRRRLFSYARDRRYFLVLLEEACGRFEMRMHSVSLLTNHVHLMPRGSREDTFSNAIKNVAQRYASWRNRRRGGSGKLFEERFYAKPLKDENHFGLTQAYIELNARRAGLTFDVHEHEWSSLGLHTGLGRPEWNRRFEGWVTPSDWYLGLGADPVARQKAYRKWLRMALENAEEPAHWKAVRAIEERHGPRPRRPNGESAR